MVFVNNYYYDLPYDIIDMINDIKQKEERKNIMQKIKNELKEKMSKKLDARILNIRHINQTILNIRHINFLLGEETYITRNINDHPLPDYMNHPDYVINLI